MVPIWRFVIGLAIEPALRAPEMLPAPGLHCELGELPAITADGLQHHALHSSDVLLGLERGLLSDALARRHLDAASVCPLGPDEGHARAHVRLGMLHEACGHLEDRLGLVDLARAHAATVEGEAVGTLGFAGTRELLSLLLGDLPAVKPQVCAAKRNPLAARLARLHRETGEVPGVTGSGQETERLNLTNVVGFDLGHHGVALRWKLLEDADSGTLGTHEGDLGAHVGVGVTLLSCGVADVGGLAESTLVGEYWRLLLAAFPHLEGRDLVIPCGLPFQRMLGQASNVARPGDELGSTLEVGALVDLGAPARRYRDGGDVVVE